MASTSKHEFIATDRGGIWEHYLYHFSLV